MTAHALKGDAERCLASGMDSYLSKPIKPDALYQVLAEVVPTPTKENEVSLSSMVDWHQALGHVRGDVQLLRELAVIFVEHCPIWLSDLRNGMNENKLDRVRLTAHTLKGSLSTFAATRPHRSAEELEQIAQSGQEERLEGALAQLDEELASLLPPMTAFARGGPA